MTEQDTDTRDAIARLTEEVARFNSHRFVRLHNSPIRLVLFQFVRGLAFGLGSLLGATVLASLIAWWLTQFEFLPVIGEWMVILADEFQRALGDGTLPDVNQ